MDKQTIAHNLKLYAVLLKQTRLPAEEVEAAGRIVNCAKKLEQLAKELEADEANNQQGE